MQNVSLSVLLVVLQNFRKTYGKYRKSTEGKNILCTNREIMHLCQVNKIGQYMIYINPLSSTGSILSNTDLSDLSTAGTCDIFVYEMRHRVM